MCIHAHKLSFETCMVINGNVEFLLFANRSFHPVTSGAGGSDARVSTPNRRLPALRFGLVKFVSACPRLPLSGSSTSSCQKFSGFFWICVHLPALRSSTAEGVCPSAVKIRIFCGSQWWPSARTVILSYTESPKNLILCNWVTPSLSNPVQAASQSRATLNRA